uniref:Citrate transporter-like domain-containing protein n=1 Tax=candidate division WOR-3 bacterium TaxID=2052148 RepID=A0A7V3ZYT7_UNCW3
MEVVSSKYLLITIFTVSFLFIAWERWHRTVISMLAAIAVIVLGYLTPQEAWNFIDFNTLGLLLGMMIIVSFFRRTGFFEYIAIKAIKVSKGDYFILFAFFFILTGVVSAFLDNVTTVLVFSPIIILVTKMTGISPFPYLIGEIIASNIGGTATLIGDPPNIIIGSASGLSFNDFIANLALPVAVIMVLTIFFLKWMFSKEYKISGKFDVSKVKIDERGAVKNKGLLVKTLFVFGFVIIGFVLHDKLKILPSIVALTGAVVLLFLNNENPEPFFHEVEWTTLFFFGGLFILVGALEKFHIIESIANFLLRFSKGELTLILIIGFLSFFFTTIMGAIPFVVTMAPIINAIINKMPNIHGETLWWTLSLTSCFMGNATLISAAANLVVADISGKTEKKITFKNYLKYGFPASVFTFIIAMGYVILKYYILR